MVRPRPVAVVPPEKKSVSSKELMKQRHRARDFSVLFNLMFTRLVVDHEEVIYAHTFKKTKRPFKGSSTTRGIAVMGSEY